VNQRSPRHDVIDEGSAIRIDDACAGRALDEEGSAADCLIGSDGTVDAAWEDLLGTGEERGGF